MREIKVIDLSLFLSTMKVECECEQYVVIWLIVLHYHLTQILKNPYLFD